MWRLAIILLVPWAALAQDDPWADEDWGDDADAAAWTGFVETGLGARLQNDTLIDSDATLEDLRLRVESEWQPADYTISFKGDAWYDGVDGGLDGEVRDLSVAFSIGDSIDVRLGRQVQTWGTGDLVFLNDLFPKDFVSFFSGRDDEYLKAPGNALRLTRFGEKLNVDFVWTPAFEPDVYLTGERFSFFSPLAGENVAPQGGLDAVEPGSSLANGEFAIRLFKTVEGSEYALYGYHGFFKQPSALTAGGQPTFAPLDVFGASLRRPAGPGLMNLEIAYYDSRDDRAGADPLTPNSQLRLLAGYEWEAKPRFTVGLQYYLEQTLDFRALLGSSPAPEFEPEEYRQLVTNRLTYRSARDRYTWSLFTFYSPSDEDFYLRPSFSYRYSDQWTFVAGANLFGGNEPQTFFNQLQDASNAYLRLRYNY